MLLEVLYVFMSASKAHVVFIEKQLHHDKQPLELQKLLATGWACRYSAINAICRIYDFLLLALKGIGETRALMKLLLKHG